MQAKCCKGLRVPPPALAHQSVVPRVGNAPPPLIPTLGSIEIDQAAFITVKVAMMATMMISLFVMDIGRSRGFHQSPNGKCRCI
jgi:hypothetical protein